MSIDLNKNYDSTTRLNEFWKIVKQNFATVESFSNETRTKADNAATPAEVNQLLADFTDSTPAYLEAINAFKAAMADPSVRTDVLAAMNTIANSYAKKQAGTDNIDSFNHNAVGNIAVGYLKDHVFPGNEKKSGFVMSNYDPATDKTHIMFIDWATGRTFVKNNLNEDWVDVFAQFDAMRTNYNKVHLVVDNPTTITPQALNNDVESETHNMAYIDDKPYLVWSYVITDDMAIHSYLKTTSIEVKFQGLRSGKSRFIYVDINGKRKYEIAESDWTEVDLTNHKYKITIPAQDVLLSNNTVEVKVYGSDDYEKLVNPTRYTTYVHANHFEVLSGTVKTQNVKMSIGG